MSESQQLSQDETQLLPPSTNSPSTIGTLIIIILLLFIYPIGLILMWNTTNWPKGIKWLITTPVILTIFFLIIGFILIPLYRTFFIQK
jgi:hypothetical protein